MSSEILNISLNLSIISVVLITTKESTSYSSLYSASKSNISSRMPLLVIDPKVLMEMTRLQRREESDQSPKLGSLQPLQLKSQLIGSTGQLVILQVEPSDRQLCWVTSVWSLRSLVFYAIGFTNQSVVSTLNNYASLYHLDLPMGSYFLTLLDASHFRLSIDSRC